MGTQRKVCTVIAGFIDKLVVVPTRRGAAAVAEERRAARGEITTRGACGPHMDAASSIYRSVRFRPSHLPPCDLLQHGKSSLVHFVTL